MEFISGVNKLVDLVIRSKNSQDSKVNNLWGKLSNNLQFAVKDITDNGMKSIEYVWSTTDQVLGTNSDKRGELDPNQSINTILLKAVHQT